MSEIRATTISDLAGTGPVAFTGQIGIKAGVSYTQTTVTINNSLNISSVTDVAAGRYTPLFTVSFSDIYYRVSGIEGINNGNSSNLNYADFYTTKTVGAVPLTSLNQSATSADATFSDTHITGDLA